MLEKDIQTTILEWLGYQRGTFVWRQNQSMTISKYTNRFGQDKTRAFKSASVEGISDILGVWRGIPLAIEVKKWPNKPSQEQEHFLEQFAAAGGIAMVAYSLEHVMQTLTKYEAPQVYDPKIVFWNRQKP